MKNEIRMLRSVTGIQMMSFVITTEEGGVIVIDGGFAEDAQNLLDTLCEMTGEAVPFADAVILTHPHCDHITAFTELAEHRADAFRFGAVYYHFPSVQFLREDPDCAVLSDFYRLLPKFADRAVIVSGGDEYGIRGARLEFFGSPDCSLTENRCNNASLVFLLTLNGTRILFTGDCGREEGEKILARYGSRLKADYCQMAHHGQNGVGRAFYEAVRPEKGCFWCAPAWLWNNDAGKGYNTHTFQTIITRGWMDEIVPGHRDYVIMNGTQSVEL